MLRAEAIRAWATDSPGNLAVLRIATFTTVLLSADVFEAPAWIAAHAPSSSSGIASWLWQVLHALGPGAPRAVQGVLYASAALALLGVFPRAAAAVCAAALFWLVGAAQAIGGVFHCHHLFLFPALLAFSPCGDALTIRDLRTSPERSLSYGVPLRLAALVIASFFFFPGVWKLAASGFGWTEPDALKSLLHLKWFEEQRVPAFRLDQHPALLRLSAVAVLLFELGLPAVVLWQRTRPWAVPILLAFHLATGWMIGISFTSLWLLYAALVNWDRVLKLRQDTVKTPQRSWVPAFVVGAIVVGGQAVAGVRGTEASWPFACYPAFRDRAPAKVTTLRIERREGQTWVALRFPLTPRRLAIEREGKRRFNSGQREGLRPLLGIARDGEYRMLWLERSTSPEERDQAARTIAVYAL